MPAKKPFSRKPPPVQAFSGSSRTEATVNTRPIEHDLLGPVIQHYLRLADLALKPSTPREEVQEAAIPPWRLT